MPRTSPPTRTVGGELLLVVGAALLDPVLGDRAQLPRGELLQDRLVVAVALAADPRLHPRAEQPLDQLGRARPGPGRGRPRRTPPRARRRGCSPCRGRPRAPRPCRAAPRRPGRATAPRRRGPACSRSRRGASRAAPRACRGRRAYAMSVTTSPSTESPRNSSRSFVTGSPCSNAKERCVSAARRSAGVGERHAQRVVERLGGSGGRRLGVRAAHRVTRPRPPDGRRRCRTWGRPGAGASAACTAGTRCTPSATAFHVALRFGGSRLALLLLRDGHRGAFLLGCRRLRRRRGR